MSFCRHVCRQALPPHGNSKLDHVWVSDELLSYTFAKFVSGQRRHGSCVPGPLEARRRLARRRNMNLASVGGGGSFGAGIDPAVLFGFSDPNRRPSPPEVQLPTYPEPVVDFAGAPPFSDSSHERNHGLKKPQPKLTPVGTEDVLDKKAVVRKLLSSMRPNSSAKDIRKIVRDLDMNLRDTPSLSRIVFDYILNSQTEPGWTPSNIYGFLGDTTLNPPGSGNFTALIEHLVTHACEKHVLDSHFDYVKQALALGIVSLEELETIITRMPHIRTLGGTLKTAGCDTLWIYHRTLWDGLKSCSVLGPKDLSDDIIRSWMDQLMQSPISDHTVAMGKDVIGTLAASDRLHSHFTLDVILKVMKLFLSTQKESKHTQQAMEQSLQQCLASVHDLLRQFRPGTVVSLIFQITEQLTSAPQYDKSRPHFLIIWTSILQRMPNPHALLHTPFWESFEAIPDNLFATWSTKHTPKLSADQTCFLRLWIMSMLGQNTRNYRAVDRRRLQLFKLCLSHLDRIPSQTQNTSAISKLVLQIQRFSKMGLPNTNKISITTARCEYERRLDYQVLPPSMIRSLETLDSGAISLPDVFWDYEQYNELKFMLFPLFERMSREIDITEPGFVDRVLHYTETNSPGRGALLRVLRRHAPVKIALSKSWGKRQRPRPTNSHSHGGVVPNSPSLDSHGCTIPDPHACLDTIHSMALIFACSEKISLATSWALTHWCYRFLVDHQAPLMPVMVRTMYHAGIQKYREAGRPVSQGRRDFIMRKIREAEGSKVATAFARGIPMEMEMEPSSS